LCVMHVDSLYAHACPGRMALYGALGAACKL